MDKLMQKTKSVTANNLGDGFTNVSNFIGNVDVKGPPTPPSPTTTVNQIKFNSLRTQLFLVLNELRRYRLIEEFSWIQFNDIIVWLLDKDQLEEPLIVDSSGRIFYR